jgi:hypothetical protein
MSYRITIIKGKKKLKTIEQDLPPTDKQIESLSQEYPGTVVDVCRLDLSDEDFDYRKEII